MAIGDSISAALLARNGERNPEVAPHEEGVSAQAVLQPSSSSSNDAPLSYPSIQEWRGVSYAIGADLGALTFPNILAHYTHVEGASTGHHPVVCVGGEQGGCHPPSDGLNAAVSGSIAASLWGQVAGGSLPFDTP